MTQPAQSALTADAWAALPAAARALVEEIAAKVPAEQLAHPRDDFTICQTVNVGRVKAGTFEGGIGSILRALGADAGGAFLDALKTAATQSPAIKWALRLIVAGTFDFGDAESRQRIAAMATPEGGNMLTADQAAALLALGEVADPLTLEQVSLALNAAAVGLAPGQGV